MNSTARIGLIFILASSVGYALFPIFTKFIYLYSDLGEMDVAFYRFIIAVPLMWVATFIWMHFSKPPKLTKPLPRVKLMLTSLFVSLAALAGFFGLRRMDAGLYVVLFFSYPAMTVLINAMLGERLPLRGWVALGLTTLGVILTVINPNPNADMLFSWAGVGIALFNALFVALFIITNERVQRGYPTTARASAWTTTGTLFFFVPMAFIKGGVAAPPDLRVAVLLVGLGAFATVLPYFGLILGNKMIGASRAAIVGTLEPIVAVLLAWLLLGERFTPLQIVGGVLIVASILVLEARIPRRKFTVEKKSPATPN